MFEIAGLFLDDRSEAHLEAVSSLSQYLDGLLGEDLNENALFAMQKQTYDIHAIGVNSLERAVMTERSFDCKGGCDSCCHATDVGLTPSELFYLSNHIASEGLHQKDGKHSVPPRDNEMAACPLLEEGWCTVYEARPMSCRYILSTDVASCLKRRETLIGGAKLPPPFSHFRSSIAAAQFVMFRKRGLDARWLTLDHSIQHALDNPTLVNDWLSGKEFSNLTHKLEKPNGNFGALVDSAEQHWSDA